MAAAPADFESWLSDKLRALNTDEEVFKPYIVSILEDTEDDGEDDPAEAIDEVLAGMSDNESENRKFRKLILERWQQEKSSPAKKSEEKTAAAEHAAAAPSDTMDINARLASITGSQNEAYKSSRSSSSKNNGPEPDRAVKEAIMAQYAGAVEEESEEESDDGDIGGGSNSNAEHVAREQAEHREKCKQAALAKKEKDKEDRENQKKTAEDKKKKAQDKTAKGERRA